ncbi:MAG: NAD(+) synthase, partial [Clostridia bacterium]|nr:NAD(+) synthase [Clostridia bacterium]
MKDGFIRVAAAAPKVSSADCEGNTRQILRCMEQAAAQGAALLVLPEHSITGYALGDLFLQHTLQEAAERSLCMLIEASAGIDTVVAVGLPVRRNASLYSCAAVFQRGRLLGVVPKLHLPNYAEFYEARHFRSGRGLSGSVRLAGFEAPFGADLIFECGELPDFKIGIEICEDLWVPCPPSAALAQAGATVIANLSASPFVTGKQEYRSGLVRSQSARCIAGYIYSSSGEGESSTDLVFAGHLMISENGRMLGEALRSGMIINDLDTQLLTSERRRMTTFAGDEGAFRTVPFSVERRQYDALKRPVERHPFVPEEGRLYRQRCAEVLDIQSAGLAQRLRHTHAKTAVVAVSGGLDSTLALLVAARAVRQYGLDCGISAITMPGPGTTQRTKGNADALCAELHAGLRTIPISQALELHLKDIGHGDSHDVT